MGQKVSVQEQIMNMKITSKRLSKQAEKQLKQEAATKKKVKKAIEDGDMETAKIYAQTAIRQHSQYKSYLTLSSRLDGVCSRMKSAEASKNLTPQMVKASKAMGSLVSESDLVKLTSTMEKFGEVFEDLDVRAGVMDSAMAGATASATPQDQVDELMKQVADEHGLDIAKQMDAAGMATSNPAGKVGDSEIEASEERLRKLREQTSPGLVTG